MEYMSERDRGHTSKGVSDLLGEIEKLRIENDDLHRENTALRRMNDELRKDITAFREISHVQGINHDQAVACELNGPLMIQKNETVAGLRETSALDSLLLLKALQTKSSADPVDGYQVSIFEVGSPVKVQSSVKALAIPAGNTPAPVPTLTGRGRGLTKKSPEEDRINLFLSLFCGRQESTPEDGAVRMKSQDTAQPAETNG